MLQIRSVASLFLTFIPSTLCAQTIDISKIIPHVSSTDSKGVDLLTGKVVKNLPLLSFGGSNLSASLVLRFPNGGGSGMCTNTRASTGIFMHNIGCMMNYALEPQAQESGGYTEALLTFRNPRFGGESGTYQIYSGYQHTNPDGTKYYRSVGPTYMTSFVSGSMSSGVYNRSGDFAQFSPGGVGTDGTDVLFKSIEFADGELWTFYRQKINIPSGIDNRFINIARTRFVVSSRGFGLQFLYVSDTSPSSAASAGSWLAPTKVSAYNKAYTFCDESLLVECPSVTALPSSSDITYDSELNTVRIVTPGNAGPLEISFKGEAGKWLISSISNRSISQSNTSYTYGMVMGEYSGTPIDYVKSVSDLDGTWQYAYSTTEDEQLRQQVSYMTRTDPAGRGINVSGNYLFGIPETIRDELGKTTSISSGEPWYRVNDILFPESDFAVMSYDERGNIQAVSRTPKSGSTQPSIIHYSASYPIHCINPRTCNKPDFTSDARGARTDYTYDPVHGGVLTETGPAVNGVRPQKRFTYGQRYAWVKNASGGYSQAASPIWLLVRESTCKSGAASGSGCAIAGDEVVTDYDYGPDAGPNTLLLRGKVVTADGVSLRTCYGYDAMGNRISETEPRAGLTSCP